MGLAGKKRREYISILRRAPPSPEPFCLPRSPLHTYTTIYYCKFDIGVNYSKARMAGDKLFGDRWACGGLWLPRRQPHGKGMAHPVATNIQAVHKSQLG